MDSPYTSDLKDDTDLTAHGAPSTTMHSNVSSDVYAWGFIVGSVALLWIIGRGFRSVNS